MNSCKRKLAEKPHPLLLVDLKPLPADRLLELRKNLALLPLDEAFSHLPPELRSSLDRIEESEIAKGSTVAKTLAAALGGDYHCWSYDNDVLLLEQATKSMKTVLPETRATLLETLRDPTASQSFTKIVKRAFGIREGAPFMRLGKDRTMWLLGAEATEPHVRPRQPKKKRRRVKGKSAKKGTGANETQAMDTDESDEEDDDSS